MGASSQMSKNPCEARNPAVKSKLSPGRKAPTNRPDSAKTIAKIPKYPTDSIILTRSRFRICSIIGKTNQSGSLSFIYINIKLALAMLVSLPTTGIILSQIKVLMNVFFEVGLSKIETFFTILFLKKDMFSIVRVND